MSDKKGIFTISLDTELAWGSFDVGRKAKFESAYRKTPEVIERLCDLFDKYQISATWAIVSHLLVDCDEGRKHTGRTQPSFNWIDDWFGELPCSDGSDRALWYAPWLVDRLRSCEADHEIGLHGATHMQLGDDGCSRKNAVEELETAVETLLDFGVEPKSFVFPRNDVGHVDVLAEHGIQAYRGADGRWYEQQYVPNEARAPLRFFDEVTQRPPPVVEPSIEGGLVEISGSQAFRPSYGGWKYTLPGSGVRRAKKGLISAAQSGRLYHLWLHPFNLGHAPTKDLRRFEAVLRIAKRMREHGEIECRSMHEVAELTRQGLWD